MHRTSTDRAYLESGALTLDADGIPVDIGTMQARLAALEEPQITQISTGIYGVGERYTTPISTGIYQIGA